MEKLDLDFKRKIELIKELNNELEMVSQIKDKKIKNLNFVVNI